MPNNLPEKPKPVKLIIAATCDRCRCMRSRRGGFIVEVGTRQQFVCRECVKRLETQVARDYVRAGWGGTT